MKPFKTKITYLQKGQPSFYICLDKWQKDEELKYFIKFYVNRVLIGINVSDKLMQSGFINKLLKNTKFTFTEYNGKKIDDIKNFKKEAKNTHDFHVSIQLNQKFDDFFSDFNSTKGKVVISQISEILTNIIERMNPILKTLV